MKISSLKVTKVSPTRNLLLSQFAKIRRIIVYRKGFFYRLWENKHKFNWEWKYDEQTTFDVFLLSSENKRKIIYVFSSSFSLEILCYRRPKSHDISREKLTNNAKTRKNINAKTTFSLKSISRIWIKFTIRER